MRTELAARFLEAKRIALIGHVRPDGDAIGACLGLKRYLEDNYPEITADVWLESFPDKYSFLFGAEAVRHDADAEHFPHGCASEIGEAVVGVVRAADHGVPAPERRDDADAEVVELLDALEMTV